MTREEMLNHLEIMSSYPEYPGDGEALDMAIEALKAQPCEDCVSREAFKCEVERIASEEEKEDKRWTAGLRYSLTILNNLSSVTPARKQGKWIDDKCSVCGKGIEDLISSPEWYRNEEPNFCPYCGADVQTATERGSAESEDKE